MQAEEDAPASREEWSLYFRLHRAPPGNEQPEDAPTPSADARFALEKLAHPFYRVLFAGGAHALTPEQEEGLRALRDGLEVDLFDGAGARRTGWDAYCHILTPDQIELVGW